MLAAPEGARISEVAWSEVVSVAPSMAQEEVSQIISNYDVVSLPVVDHDNRMLGVVTVDDIIDVIQEEQTRMCRSSAVWKPSSFRTCRPHCRK